MSHHAINTPDFSGISSERKEFLSKIRYDLYFEYNLEKYSDEKYLSWDTVRYLELPGKFESHEELWFVIRLCRSKGFTPVYDTNGEYFTIGRIKFLEELLHNLDLSLGGNFLDTNLTKNEQKIFLQNGLVDEAISSSQLEGALTSSKVARDMIAKNRRPISRDEKMILNNYRAMNYVKDELTQERLSKENLIYLQSILTHDTLENPDEVGRLRKDEDEIVVQDILNGKVYHVPPPAEFLMREMDSLLRYANDEDVGFTHPFIKAVVLHFWIGFLHPFCDGNGRTARAIFYWYLLKKGYWGFSYIPISQVIQYSKKQYTDAYIYSEQDNNDLTYFLVYIANKTNQAFKEFKRYVGEKKKQQKGLSNELSHLGFNDRQNKLIGYFLENPQSYTNVSIHGNYYSIAKNTAKSDLSSLCEAGFLKKEKQGLYVNYFPSPKLLELVSVE